MVSLADARRVIAAAEKKAAEVGQPMNIAVADEGGNLVAHIRMDNAWIGSIDISQKKAFTSRAFDITTNEPSSTLEYGDFFGNRAHSVCVGSGPLPLSPTAVRSPGSSWKKVCLPAGWP